MMSPMKTIFTLLLLVFATAIMAEATDNHRMSQDLRIAERILTELMTSDRSTGHIINTRSQVHAVYIPDFGVYIEAQPPGQTMLQSVQPDDIQTVDIRDGQVRITARSSDADSARVFLLDNSPSEEYLNRIKAAIDTYLSEYASAIGQLKSGDRVVVAIRSAGGFQVGGNTVYVGGRRSNMPAGFVKSVRQEDLARHLSGRISSDELKSRIVTSSMDEAPGNDMRIFMNILETGLDRQSNPSFHLIPGLTYLPVGDGSLILAGTMRTSATATRTLRMVHQEEIRGRVMREVAGAIGQADSLARIEHMDMQFRINDARRGDSVYVVLPDTVIDLTQTLRGATQGLEALGQSLGALSQSLSAGFGGGERTQYTPEQIMEHYEQFEQTLKELVLDYGRTLGSLSNDQTMIITVGQRHNLDNLPTRLILRVEKSTFDAHARGRLSRDAALVRIRITREY